METIRTYSTIEQSRKLAEILPLESADMVLLHEEPYETSDSKFDGLHQALCVPFNKYDKSWRQKYKNISYFPCWSLASLLGVLPKRIELEGVAYELSIYLNGLYYWNVNNGNLLLKVKGKDNPVDACVAMIELLHEQNFI